MSNPLTMKTWSPYVVPDRFCGLEIDHQLEFRRQFDRQIGRPRTLVDLVDVHGKTAVALVDDRSIGHQVAALHEQCPARHRRYLVRHRERCDPLRKAHREPVGERQDRLVAPSFDGGKRLLEFAFASHREIVVGESELRRRLLCRLELQGFTRMFGIGDDRDPLEPRYRFLQKLQPLAHEVEREQAHARHVAARPGEARDNLSLDRVGAKDEHDRELDTGAHHREDGEAAPGHDHVGLCAHDVTRHLFEPLAGALAPPRFDDEVLALYVAEFAHAGAKCREIGRAGTGPLGRDPGHV